MKPSDPYSIVGVSVLSEHLRVGRYELGELNATVPVSRAGGSVIGVEPLNPTYCIS